jgi:signal transduction histidine kinase
MAQAVEEREHALSVLFERLQRIIDTIDSAIILTENDVVSMLNPAAQDSWKLSPKDPLPQTLLTLRIGFHEEIRIEEEQYDIRISPIRGFGLLWVIEKVTQRVQDREQLARTRRLAIVGRMLAQITHEVRNPLNAMSLNTEMLFDEELGEEAQEMLSIISSEIQRLEKITERYLSLSRKRNPDLVEASPKIIIKEILQFSAAAYGHIQFSLSGTEDTVVLDEEAVRSAIHNLLRNAIEANSTSIDISIQFGEFVKITIQDNGEGIESVDQIFDPFFTTKAQGTGLGLVISQQELAESGCTVHCTSIKGEGTCFVIEIPHRQEEQISCDEYEHTQYIG